MKLLAQLNPRPRGFGDGSYYRMRDLSTALKMTVERSFGYAQDDKGKEILSPNGSRMTNWKRFYRLTAPE